MRHRSNAAHLLWSRLQSGELAPLLTFLGVTGLVLVFGLLANQTRGGGALSFDAAVQAALQSPTGHGPIGPPWLEEAVRDVTALGSFAFLGLLLVAVVGYLLLVRKRGMALLMLVAVLGGTVMSSLLKVGFDRRDRRSRARSVSLRRAFRAGTPPCPRQHFSPSACCWRGSPASRRKEPIFWCWPCCSLCWLA
jgi:hypothetical protein